MIKPLELKLSLLLHIDKILHESGMANHEIAIIIYDIRKGIDQIIDSVRDTIGERISEVIYGDLLHAGTVVR